jgi:hypothetical protein
MTTRASESAKTGRANSSVAGCLYIEWKLARHSDGTATGIVYYSNMSGVSMANGNVQDGKSKLMLTSVDRKPAVRQGWHQGPAQGNRLSYITVAQLTGSASSRRTFAN